MSTVGTLQRTVDSYVNERQQLGFQCGGNELRRFALYADAQGHTGPLTLELQLGWARCHVRRTTPGTGTKRLQTLRPFARYYRQFEPLTVIVDPLLLGPARRRATPHIYTNWEIKDLLVAAGGLEPAGGLRPATYVTLFGLIAATGLRLSEALNATEADFDLDRSLLTVRKTKFRKSRALPLHQSTVAALQNYARRPDRQWTGTGDASFFICAKGHTLKKRTVHWVFEQLRDSLEWTARGAHPKPRIHDLRHYSGARIIPSRPFHEEQSVMTFKMLYRIAILD